jgi:hypothetical protein
MSVAANATGTLVRGTVSPLASSASINVPSGSTALWVTVQADDATSSFSAPTWNGVSMTLIGSVNTSDNLCITRLYGLVNPASGSNSLSVSWSGGAPNVHMLAVSFSGSLTSSVAACFTGFVSQANNVAGSSNTVTVTSATGDLAIAAGNGNNSTTYTINQTNIYNQTLDFSDAASRAAGAATVVFTGTLTGLTATNCIAGCDVVASGGAALVLGWQRGIDDFVVKPALRFQPPPALTLTPATLPVGIKGMAWFDPPDRDPPPKRPIVESLPAINLTPATLPAKIAGMAWFEPPDRDVPLRRPLVESLPAWDAQVFQTAAVIPQGWGIAASELVRRSALFDHAPPFALSPIAPAPSGWRHGDDVFPQRRQPVVDPVAFTVPTAVTVGISGMGWFEPPDDLPRKRLGFVDVESLTVPAAVSVGISGMGWFQPPDDLPRKRLNFLDVQSFAVQTSFAVGISGMGWFEPPDRDPPPRRPTVEQVASFIGPFTSAAVGISGISWSQPPDPLPFKPRYFVDPPVPVFFAPISVNWEFFSGDTLWLRDAPIDFPPAFLGPFTSGAVGISGMGWFEPPDDLPRKRLNFVDVESFTVPAAVTVGISGMGWFQPPDRDSNIKRPTIEQTAAFVGTVPSAPVGISGIGWFNPPDRDPPPRRPTVEQLSGVVLTPATLPVGITGIPWATPSELQIITRAKSWSDFGPAWYPQPIVQVVVNASEWIIRARRRYRR